MPDSAQQDFGMLPVPIECQRESLLEAGLRLPAGQLPELGRVDPMATDLDSVVDLKEIALGRAIGAELRRRSLKQRGNRSWHQA